MNPTTGKLLSTTAQKIPDSPDDFSDFAWAPDAKHIVYTGWDNKIRLYATDTKAMTSFDVGSGMNHGPSRAKSDRELFFESYDPPSRTAHVKVLDVVSGKTRNLLPPLKGFTAFAAANGKRATYMRPGSRGYELVVHDADPPHEQVVASGMMRPFPQLSSQGDRVLFVRMGGADPEHGGLKGGSLWVVNADSSNSRRLASAWGISSALWDPSGRFAAYLAKPDSSSDVTDLRILDVSTGTQLGHVSIDGLGHGQHLLTDWSGDGTSIGFYVTNVFWEYWVIRNLEEAGR